MYTKERSQILSTGLAMFSMFFGAGNVIFPLVVGQAAGDRTLYAIMGLLITAVGVPFLGLLAILLFKGNYERFFGYLGKVPGFLLASFIMLLIGPLGGLPRCIALSFSTVKISWPFVPFTLFSLTACFIIFFCTWKKNRIVDVLGKYLTPLLLFGLSMIVIAGLFSAESLPPSDWSAVHAFNHGLIEGYNTMDLLAAFFFSSIIVNTIVNEARSQSEKEIFTIALKASGIGAGLLALVYIGFSFIAGFHAQDLSLEGQGELLGALTLKLLGPYAGLVASATIALACLTTAIALAAVFAEFLQKILSRGKLSYAQSLCLTLMVSYGISALEFNGIVAFLSPMLQVIYPALIIYTIAVIIWKLRDNKTIQITDR